MSRVYSKLKIYKKDPSVVTPKYATDGSACFDLHAHIPPDSVVRGYSELNEPIERIIVGMGAAIYPGERLLIPTGIIFDIPTGYSIRLHSRSGLTLKNGLVLANGEGVVDEDYCEETFIIISNISNTKETISHGQRIAQAEIVSVTRFSDFEIIPDAPSNKTARNGGFGSTGK